MPPKRSISLIEDVSPPATKRPCPSPSPTATDASRSAAPSTSTPPTTFSHSDDDDTLSDESSVVSSDSDDDSSDDEPANPPQPELLDAPPSDTADSDDEDNVTITVDGHARPRLPQRSKLLGRLHEFLPRLRAANEELGAAGAKGVGFETLVADEDGGERGSGDGGEAMEGQFVEMDLGLGVLEEKAGGEGEGEGEDGEQQPTDTMDRLLGRERKKVDIREV